MDKVAIAALVLQHWWRQKVAKVAIAALVLAYSIDEVRKYMDKVAIAELVLQRWWRQEGDNGELIKSHPRLDPNT